MEDKEKDNQVTYFSTLLGKQIKKTDIIQLTQEEFDAMEKKLDHHIDDELVDVTKKLAAADSKSPNLKKLKNRQQVVIKRIQHLKQTLKNSRIIEHAWSCLSWFDQDCFCLTNCTKTITVSYYVCLYFKQIAIGFDDYGNFHL